MTRNEMDAGAMQRAFLGHEEAAAFMRLMCRYVHAIDDIEDEATDAEFRLRTFAMAIEIYTHPFFLKHLAELRQVILLTTNAYADVVGWEKSAEKWQREFADVYRHFAQEIALAVAGICAREAGGSAYEHMRSISAEWRTMAYWQHHDQHGAAT